VCNQGRLERGGWACRVATGGQGDEGSQSRGWRKSERESRRRDRDRRSADVPKIAGMKLDAGQDKTVRRDKFEWCGGSEQVKSDRVDSVVTGSDESMPDPRKARTSRVAGKADGQLRRWHGQRHATGRVQPADRARRGECVTAADGGRSEVSREAWREVKPEQDARV